MALAKRIAEYTPTRALLLSRPRDGAFANRLPVVLVGREGSGDNDAVFGCERSDDESRRTPFASRPPVVLVGREGSGDDDALFGCERSDDES